MQAHHRPLPNAPFVHAWSSLGGRDAQAVLGDLERQYAEPHRAYHNATHIAECVAWLETSRELAQRPSELLIAIYFHDAIYEPMAVDNEALSAARIEAHATAAGIGPAARCRIVELILSTREHAPAAGDEALLSDIDLAILGASPHRFEAYERAIRVEYAAIDDDTYRAGRLAVLRSFAERTAIYHTPLFQELEAAARRNLAASLARLTSQKGTTTLPPPGPTRTSTGQASASPTRS